MNNSDMPASPVRGCDNGLFNLKDGMTDSNYLEQGQFSTGLTKREAFAVAAMQGLCANQYNVICDDNSAKEAAVCSLIVADALLKQLEE